MAGTFLKWLIPCVIVVGGGTALALAATDPAATAQLAASAGATLGSTGSWASLAIDGRDVLVSGTTTSQQSVDAVVARIASVPGVRSVASAVSFAESARPYPFSAVLAEGKVSLAGGYPDEVVHRALLADAGPGVADSTRLLSGVSDPVLFAAGAAFGLDALRSFDNGKVELSDLDLSISGRARSSEAFDALARLPGTVPAGIRLVSLRVTPPLVEDYQWSAKFDGTRLSLEGNTPDAGLVEKLEALVPANVPARMELVTASGEPSGFAANTLVLLKSLLSLEQGEAAIRGGSVSISGAPSSAAVAEDVTAAVTAIGGTINLDPPRVANYAVSLVKADGKLTVSGFVPTAASRDSLAALPGADVDNLKLGRGAPEGFAGALEFGTDVLAQLSDGRLDIKGTRITIGGRTATVDGFRTASAAIAKGAPQGFTLAAAQLHPPLADPFTWSASKAGDGAVTLAGHVPYDAPVASLRGKVARLAADTAEPADGAPADFTEQALEGLEILALLDTGRLAFDGANWSIEGAVDSAEKAGTANAAYAAAGLRAAGWTYTLTAPADATPLVTPYLWSADKAADGTIAFGGYVPTEAMRQSLAASAGNVGRDATALASGEPAGFSADTAAGLAALSHLLEGRAAFESSRWKLTGIAAAQSDIDAAMAALATGSDGGSQWTADLRLPPSQEPSSSEPAPASSAPPSQASEVASSSRLPSSSETAASSAPSVEPPSSSEQPSSSIEASSVSEAPSLIEPSPSEPSSSQSSASSAPATPVTPSQPSTAIKPPRWADLDALPLITCRVRVDKLAGRNAILFKAGSATLAAESLPVLDELAADLEICPSTYVHVQGYTDSDGDADANLALSVARAETVVNSLIERGVSDDRLYAEGFGETEPIASNDTKDGKQKNRRIAFVITPE